MIRTIFGKKVFKVEFEFLFVPSADMKGVWFMTHQVGHGFSSLCVSVRFLRSSCGGVLRCDLDIGRCPSQTKEAARPGTPLLPLPAPWALIG